MIVFYRSKKDLLNNEPIKSEERHQVGQQLSESD